MYSKFIAYILPQTFEKLDCSLCIILSEDLKFFIWNLNSCKGWWSESAHQQWFDKILYLLKAIKAIISFLQRFNGW